LLFFIAIKQHWCYTGTIEEMGGSKERVGDLYGEHA